MPLAIVEDVRNWRHTYQAFWGQYLRHGVVHCKTFLNYLLSPLWVDSSRAPTSGWVSQGATAERCAMWGRTRTLAGHHTDAMCGTLLSDMRAQ